jgi:hypothetical protein
MREFVRMFMGMFVVVRVFGVVSASGLQRAIVVQGRRIFVERHGCMYRSEILETSSTVPVTLIRMAMVVVVMRHGTAVSTQAVENGLRIMAVTGCCVISMSTYRGVREAGGS